MKKISQGIKKGIIGTGIFSGESNQFDFCSYIIFLSVFYNIIRFIIVYYFDSLFLYFAIGIIFFISGLSVISRRLNNLQKSRFFLIGVFIPVVNIILIIYLCFAKK